MPQLQRVFSRAYVSISPQTLSTQGESAARLQASPFFRLTHPPPDAAIGDQFLSAYRAAATELAPASVLHLCFLDRVLYALDGEHHDAFAADVHRVKARETPRLFVRSAAAWQTHPAHYHEIESWATRAGEVLLGRALDWTWCHLAVTARDLLDILPRVRYRNLTVLAEILYSLRDRITTQEVDWLAWEDPYFEGRDRDEMRRERNTSAAETRKRLGYVLPVIQFLLDQDPEPSLRPPEAQSGEGSLDSTLRSEKPPEPVTVTIRDARAGDSAALARIQLASWRSAYAGILPQDYLDHFTDAEQEEDWRDLLAQPDHDLLLVAESKAGAVVGYALAGPVRSEEKEFASEVIALHILPAWRGRGIGRRLFTAAATRLRDQGYPSLVLWVLEKNSPARGFYEHLGGQLLRTRPVPMEGIDATEVSYGWPEIELLCK